ncbi:MAG: DUF6261 family protein [Bergeyella zoohelcum]|nr:DUF6261 family protein [Bergeyella zoohelcum]
MAFAQVMKNVKTFLDAEANIASLGLENVKNEFNATLSELEEALISIKKSENTEKLIALDEKRDILLVNFISHCKIYQTHPEKDKAEAAKRSVIQIETYGKDLQRRAYLDETAIINNLLSDFSKPQADADITLIGAKEWLDFLSSVNAEFEKLHTDRTQENSVKETGKTKEAREQMQQKFDRLCKAIEAMAFVNGDANYQKLASAINEEVKNALAQTKAVQGKEKKI